MPLDKQLISMAMHGGVDTKTDPKSVGPGKLLQLINGTFTSPGRIRKRNGYAALGGSPDTNMQALATFSSELLAAANDKLYSYEAAESTWRSKGAFLSPTVTQAPSQFYSTTMQTSLQSSDCAVANGVRCNVSAGVYTMTDVATGQIIILPSTFFTDAVACKVLVVSSNFVMFFVRSSDGSLNIATVPTATPTAVPTQAVFATLASTSGRYYFDACTMNTAAGQALYVAGVTAATTLSVWYSLATAPASIIRTATITTHDGDAVPVVFPNIPSGTTPVANDGPVVAYSNGSAQPLKFASYKGDLTATIYTGTLDASSFNTIAVTGIATARDSWSIFFSTFNGATKYQNTTLLVTVAAGVPGTSAVVCRKVALAAKAVLWNGTAYIVVGFKSFPQSTLYVMSASGLPVAKILPGVWGGNPVNSASAVLALPESGATSSGFTFDASYVSALVVSGGSPQGQISSTSVTVTWNDTSQSYAKATLGNMLVVGGGFPQMYDGTGPVELGFHQYPTAWTGTPGAAGTTYTYQYVACYEWFDVNNQVHRSAPSAAVTVTSASPISGSNTVTHPLPTLAISGKGSRNFGAMLVLYRTINNGTVFYQCSASGTATTPQYQSPLQGQSSSADTLTFTDQTTDAVLLGNAQLYTTGGVLANGSPGSVSGLVVYRNRIVCYDTTAPLTLWYTKQVIAGAPVEFSPYLSMQVDPRGGAVTALATMDDKLIVFKGDRIFLVTGQGPDSTGAQNDFSDAILITADCGCINQRSVVETPMGIMFQSAKGIYLLNRALQVSYIGADVESFNGSTILGAILAPATNQVRFYLSAFANSAAALVFDYRVGQWGYFNTLALTNPVVYGGQVVYPASASGSPKALQEMPASFADPAAGFITATIKTAWLKFNDLQGLQRVYKALLLMDWLSAHTLTVQVAYDFDPTIVQTDTFTLSSQTPYQVRIDLAKQKCEAIQITISDSNPSGSGESFALNGIAFEVGTKRGGFKLPATNQAG